VLGSNWGDVNRGIGILPMMPLDHGQDARATFLPKRCADFKPLHRKRLTGRADGRFPHNTSSYWGVEKQKGVGIIALLSAWFWRGPASFGEQVLMPGLAGTFGEALACGTFLQGKGGGY
jgi:hypothetical protein